MGGVDRHDQILTYYSLNRKSMKWYKKYFFHLFDICVFNASCLYRKEDANKATPGLSFRLTLVAEILTSVGPHCSVSQRKQAPWRRLEGEDQARLTERHFPSAIPRTENMIAKGTKHCSRVCHICPKVATLTPTSENEMTHRTGVSTVAWHFALTLAFADTIRTYITK